MHFYSLLSSSILFVLLLCISDSESMKTLKNLAVRRGGSLTIPCLYDKKYKSNRKYWCKGRDWLLCKIVAYTNTSGGTSVTDHPTQNMFTVELKSLQDSDSGYYWCAVEISGGSDDGDYVYLTVSSDPAVSVMNSRVSGQEGGSVSVQCLYSAGYKNKQKKWCRFKDWSSFTGWKTTTTQNSAGLVSDDRKGSVSVEMRGLQMSDAGWYWFSAGDVGVTVHLTVTERPSTTTAVTTVSATEKTSISETTSGSTTVTKNTETTTAELSQKTGLIWVLLPVGLGLLLLLTIIITCMLRKKCNGSQTETRGRVSNTAVHTAPTPESAVIYSTVIHKNKKRSPALDLENDVIYNNITKETLFQAVGDDGVIYNSVVLK
ncbi:polymeric immunoglobulin receptor-like isoform X2 [Pygocentrus nattereri]|uniref:polymeric immunoglobulin receptor-like isoform X2 n=1 Tax=Pygocentrus nattereri TaxID=42514 RepID=UPI00189160B0|nr:polymeric immunoglobulin receptor-like isoform X2 [Pygocentrus nattereri]